MSTSEGEKTEESKNDVSEDTTSSPIIPELQTPSGINGDKEMDVDETSAEDNKEVEPVIGEKKKENELDDELPPSKKRKFNDSGELSDDSSSTEFLGFPDTRTEEEKKAAAAKKEKQEKVKQDLLTFNAEAFGKGKRSRVPNKRYESLTSTIRFSKYLSSRHSEHLDNDHDGLEDRNIDDEDEIPSSHSSPRAKSKMGSSPATPVHKKQKHPDMSNPNFLKPFELGWKRELVYRATIDNNMRRNGDIYYYTPTGRKIRSMRELTDTLKSEKSTELSVGDFTFFKEPVGINDPEKEIIREAKYKNATLLKTGLSKVKLTPSKNSSPKVSASDGSTKNTKSPKLGGFKVKLSGSSKLNQGSNKKDSKRASGDNEMEIGMLPPAWSPKKGSAKQSNYSKTGSLSSSSLEVKRPCSIRCQGVSGLIPTLQCRLCLCLYHKECVGELTDDVPAGYVCKNCQMDNQDKIESAYEPTPSIAPPPLTPISSLKSNNTQSSTPPKLQRIPRPGEKAFIPLSIQHVPKLNAIPEPFKSHLAKLPPALHNLAAPPEPTKSIVGSVTTWFPPNSTLKMNANNSQTKNSDILITKPQNVVFMGERKFLVVPKGNVLSISPTIGAAVNTPSVKRMTSPTADKAPVFDGKEMMANKNLESAATMQQIPVPVNESPPTSLSSVSVLHPSDKPSLSASAAIERPTIPVSSGLPLPPFREELSIASGETQTLKENQVDATPSKTRKGGANKKTPITAPIAKNDAESRFMQNYLQNLSYGYQTLLYVFQYLKVQDLLRAGCVCTLWRDIAGHPSLWHTVRMKNSQVSNWEGLADALKKHRTKNLDLRKMLLPNSGDDMWSQFSKAIARVDSLVRIELCRCPAAVIEQLATTNNSLQVINAMMIKCDAMNITALDNLENLQELRLKSTNGFILMSDLTPLKKLTKLKHLSLTSIKDLHKQNVQVIGELVNLETLDLGECSDFPDNFGSDVITKLTKLEKLRLEKGQGSCCTFNILEAVSKISCLEQLELVNFDVKAGFDKALGACANIKKLLIIPTYISQSATTNHMVLGGVIKLKSTLSHFVWGVTLELLRVTELFVDQCEESPGKDKKKPTGNGDSIPVLKPVPIMKTDDLKDEPSTKEQPQVEILPLPTLQKLLLNCLPTTRVKILKIPFHATWRQSIVDTVN